MAYLNIPRLPDPTTNPAGPGFTSIGLTNIATGMSHRLNNGGLVSVQFAGNYWTITIGFPELTPSQALTILPFLESVGGGFTDFYIQLPTHINPSSGLWDVSTSTKRCEGDITLVTERSFSVSAWDTRGGNLSPGDLIKFTNSNKIYRVLYTTLVSNIFTATLSSPIISNLTTAGLEPNSIKFKVKMPGFVSPQITKRGVYDAFSIVLEENIL